MRRPIQVGECGEFGEYGKNENFVTFSKTKHQALRGPYKLANVANLVNMTKMTPLPPSPTRQKTK